MHNRWWSEAQPAEARIPHYHSASKMSNNVVPLRGTYFSRHASAGFASLHQRLSMVKHLRRLLLFAVLRHLRERCLSTPQCRLKGVTPEA